MGGENTTRAAALGLALLMAVGCRDKAPAPGVGRVSTHAPASASAPALVRPAIDGADAERLVRAWVEAQNALDFASYEALYAERFMGIKRVGAREVRLDRRAWLADRKSMFRSGLRVQANDLSLAVAGGAVRVRLTQTFVTDTFRDSGPKELLLISAPHGLRIAREEMLESRVEGASQGPSTLEHVHVVSGGLVYLPRRVPEAALDGPARLISSEKPLHVAAPTTHGVYVAERGVIASRLPSEVTAFAAQTFRAIDARGGVCETRIVALTARVAVIPHFGTVQHWQGVEGAKPSTPGQVAEDVWTMHGANPVLTGRLDPPCSDALWATAGSPPKVAYPPATPSPAVERTVRAAFEKLGAYARLQARFAQEGGESGKSWLAAETWSQKREGLAVVSFGPLDGVELVLVSAQAGIGCGAFSGALSALFEVDARTPAPKILRRMTIEDVGVLHASTAFDRDGDGRLEILTGPEGPHQLIALWNQRGATWSPSRLFGVTYLDCGC